MKKSVVHMAVAAAIGTYGAGFSHVAGAQESTRGLEEIVVTATRREASVQDIPLSVTAMSSEMLEVQNIENVQDLTAAVPNVLFYGGGRGVTNGQFLMRGIPRVGTYVDGVWQVSNSGLLQRQFVELDRVEILRGPQGTLVGRDSTGGSIMLYTTPPQEEFGANVRLGAGSFDRRDVSASIDVPITEKFLTRWTLASYERDGYVESVTTGIDHGLLDNQVFRGDLLWTPGERTSVRFIRSEDDQVNTTAGLQTFINYDVAYRFGWQVGIAEAHDIASRAIGGRGFSNQSQVAGFPGGRLGEYQSTKALTSPDEINNESTTLIVQSELSDLLSLKYTYGKTELQDTIWTDFAGAEFNFFTNYDVGVRDFDSHEVELTFSFDRASFVVGGFTWDQHERTRGTEWSHSDWSFPNGWGGGAGGSVGGPPVPPGFFRTIPAGIPQTLSYDDVLASPTCSRPPAFYGYDFSSSDPARNPSILSGNGQFVTINPALNPNTVAGWPRPCTAFNSWVPLFATVVGFNGISPAHDRGTLQEQDGTAFFGQVTFDITDRLDLTFGARHHKQDNRNYELNVAAAVAAGLVEARPTIWDKGFANPEQAVTAPVLPSSLTQSDFSKTTYRLAASYDLNDRFMVFFNYSEGFNSGGIDTIADSAGVYTVQFDPETIENTEIGVKSDLMEGRLRVNATYFNTDWVDIQASFSTIDRITGDPVTEVFTDNASDGEADGIDLEVVFLATDQLSLGANLGWLDTQYVNIKPGAQLKTETEFGGAPDETRDVWVQYDWPLSNGGSFMARIAANYIGEFWRSSIPNFRQDIYGGTGNEAGDITRWNARAVYRPGDGDWELSIFGNNLTDEVYLNSGFMDSIWQFDFSGVDAPREYGFGLSMRF
jgi:outer membrane receptor protein involved in Fe transport